MNVSMDGLRSGLSKDVESLKELVNDILNDDYVDHSDLADAMNDVISSTNILCSVYDDENDGDMNDIGEKNHIEIIDIEHS